MADSSAEQAADALEAAVSEERVCGGLHPCIEATSRAFP
jgi:hypothetical protein